MLGIVLGTAAACNEPLPPAWLELPPALRNLPHGSGGGG